MRVLVLASRKGGVGKTSLSRHLAVEAERRGAGPTALIDTDPQAGLSRWWNRRAAETPAFITTSLEDLPDTLEKLRLGGFGLVVVDTPPAIGATIAAHRADMPVWLVTEYNPDVDFSEVRPGSAIALPIVVAVNRQ